MFWESWLKQNLTGKLSVILLLIQRSSTSQFLSRRLAHMIDGDQSTREEEFHIFFFNCNFILLVCFCWGEESRKWKWKTAQWVKWARGERRGFGLFLVYPAGQRVKSEKRTLASAMPCEPLSICFYFFSPNIYKQEINVEVSSDSCISATVRVITLFDKVYMLIFCFLVI